jgi:hypothetical protein
MSSDDDPFPRRSLQVNQGRHTYVTAPCYSHGPGTILLFTGGGRKLENLAFKHHFRLEETYFAVDGCLMAQFAPEDTIVCRVSTVINDVMETSDE